MINININSIYNNLRDKKSKFLSDSFFKYVQINIYCLNKILL